MKYPSGSAQKTHIHEPQRASGGFWNCLECLPCSAAEEPHASAFGLRDFTWFNIFTPAKNRCGELLHNRDNGVRPIVGMIFEN